MRNMTDAYIIMRIAACKALEFLYGGDVEKAKLYLEDGLEKADQAAAAEKSRNND